MQSKPHSYLILIIATLFFFNEEAYASNPFYKLEKYTELDGLISSEVNTVIQDSRGYIWIGTNSGLSRFNGYEFINYTTLEGLNNNFVKALYEDDKGIIWIGTNQGLNYIDPKIGSPMSAKSVYDGAIVTSIIQYEDKIIFGSNLGLHFLAPNDSISHIELARTRSLIESAGKLFIGAASGLYSLEKESNTLKTEWQSDNLSEGFVRSIGHYDQNQILIATNSELHIFKDGEVESVINDSNSAFERISHVVRDSKNRLWLTADNGAFIHHANDEIYRFSESDLQKNAYYVFEDFEGNIWIATQNGLLKYSEYAFSRIDPFSARDEKGVSSFLVRDNGEAWFGGAEGKVVIQQGNGDLTELSEISELTNLKPVRKLFEDEKGRVWITTLLGGVFVWDGTDLRPFNDPKGLLRFFTFDIIQSDNQYWFGGARGLVRFDNFEFKYFGFADSPDVPFVVDIHEDQQGQYWLALNSGLGILDEESIKRIGFFNGKSCRQVISVGKDQYYVSTSNSGIFHFKYNSDSVEVLNHFTVRSGLSNNNIASLIIDDLGTIWAGTDFGVNKISKDGNIEIYEIKENLIRSKCFLNAIAEGKDHILIGTFDGALRIPKELNGKQSIAPKTYITDISILNKDYDLNEVSMDTQYYNLPVNLELPYNANYISFSFEGLSFTNTGEIQYQFMLEGLDEGFSAPTKEHTFTYPNLDPGVYTFLVKAGNSDNVWNVKPQSLSFIIRPPFWQLWWFRITVVLLLIGFVSAIVHFRIQSIRKEEKEKLELNQRIAEFRLTALRSQMNPHFIFNALYSIQHFITTNEKEAAINYLAKFASLIRLILENSGENEISLEEEVKMLELYLDLERLRFDKKFDYHIETDDFLDPEESSIPYLLIQPFVENAIIHGIRNKEGKGKIKISFLADDGDGDFIKCIIEDDGVGREAADKLKKPNPIKSQSLGLKVNRERLEILNPEKTRNTSVIIVDLKEEDGSARGTRVEIKIPNTNG